jgi:dynein heavy chain 1
MEGPYTPSTPTYLNGTNGINGSSPTPPDEAAPSSSFDSGIFRTYLLSLLPPVLGATPEEIESIFDSKFEEHVARFASEGTGVIYIVKRKDDDEGTPLLIFSPVSSRQF